MTDIERSFLVRALQLARRGCYTTKPNPRVGCVLVKHGKIIAEGWHQYAGGPHAEIHALQVAGANVRGATCYVSLEPCSHHGRTPPCADALIEAGVLRVVAAMTDPNPKVAGRGLARLRAHGVAVCSDVLVDEAWALNKGFCQRMRTGRPWVTAKLAMSLDGRTALANGDSRWITSSQARADVHRLRAASGAMLTGVGTVLADDPALTARIDAPVVQPVRVVVDSQLRMPASARILAQPGQTWIATAQVADSGNAQRLQQAGADIISLPDADGQVDLAALLTCLAQRDINEVMVEAGPTLNGALLRQGLVDEWVIYQAMSVLGDQARGLFAVPALTDMQARWSLRLLDVRQVGPDLRLILRPQDSTDC
ncbi:MAG: bifunctional diaminohydroxyphosphoribosylaminopyrimidine deaminase/5-amino-6-(5-phosphoribosylamino)uracil reductase RibD [Methylococcales bacterium]|nr:bifunctional diaminohydroxyphosphoribosylaminopyrimidine deaminase/5-amino-6-(5-phosphoribosylamino)uracil reductase RibD [Methylococcales bacterium]